MENKRKTLLVAAVCISAAFYVAGSVAAASFSIPEWDEITRGLVATFWLLAMGMAAGLTIGGTEE